MTEHDALVNDDLSDENDDTSISSEESVIVDHHFPPDLGGVKIVPARAKELRCGDKAVEPMEDSSALLSDSVALYKKFLDQGYLLFRGLLNRENVLTAKRKVFGTLQKMGVSSLLKDTSRS